MASIKGKASVFSGDTSVVDTVQNHPVLTRARDSSGNEYIYLAGCTSTTAALGVTYDEAGVTTLTTTNAVGPIAIAMAATDTTAKWGWYQIFGSATATSNAAVSDNKTLVLSAGAGKFDDADIALDQITGMWSRSAPGSSTTMTVQMNYPMALGVALD